MAIEYTLSINSDINELQNLFINKICYQNIEIIWDKNFKNQDILNINFIEEGFYASIIESKKMAIYDSIEFNLKTSIVFRFNKNYYDAIQQKKNLLTLVLKVLHEIIGDAIFNFNGDSLLLYRKDNEITLNEYFGFWSNETISLLNGLKYKIINEKEEIDYYSVQESINLNKKSNLTNNIYKTYEGKDYTKEEWEKFEAEEYKKYVEKRNKKRSSFLADEETESKNFSAESGTLKEVQYFVMDKKGEVVPIHQYPSTMSKIIATLQNGTAIDVLKYEKDDWCEVLSKDGKKGYIYSSYIVKNH